MKRFLASVILFMVFAVVFPGFPALGETTIPSVDQQEIPYFKSIGFSFKAKDFVVTELNIDKIIQVNLQTKQAIDGAVVFKAKLIFSDQTFPVKIIKPELTEFEADIMEITTKAADGKASEPLPIGHISFKLSQPDKLHSVAVGKLNIKIENEKLSGEYELYLNELQIPKAQQQNNKGK